MDLTEEMYAYTHMIFTDQFIKVLKSLGPYGTNTKKLLDTVLEALEGTPYKSSDIVSVFSLLLLDAFMKSSTLVKITHDKNSENFKRP